MENPYAPPKSEIEGADVPFKRSIWWKIYFWIITVLSFLGMTSLLSMEGSGIVDYVQFILLAFASAGLFGFVYLKKIFIPGFWIPFLAFYLIYGFAYESLSDIDMRQGMTDAEYLVGMAIGYIISLPAYYGLFKYGNKKGQPWSQA